MKKIRMLLIVTVGLAIAVVISDFLDSRQRSEQENLTKPDVIPIDLASQASRWHWSQSSAENQKIEIFADSFRQSTETHLFDLEGVELRLFNRNNKSYDQVTTQAAQFDNTAEKLYSAGMTTLILGVDPETGGVDKKPATRIRSSGVTLEARTGICTTENPAEYRFDGGSGHSTGLLYDSTNRYFRMNSDVYLHLNPSAPGLPHTEIRSHKLHYHELSQRVDLKGDVILKKGRRKTQADEATVYLNNGNLHRIELTQVHGLEQDNGRKTYLEADKATLWYSPLEILEKIIAEGSAKLRSTASESSFATWGEQLTLFYVAQSDRKQSELHEADARENAGIEVISVSHAKTNKNIIADSSKESLQENQLHRMHSEWIHLTMRTDENGIDHVETLAPGKFEVIPSAENSRERQMTAQRMYMSFGIKNHMEKLRALGDVEVLSKPPQKSTLGIQEIETPIHTWSQNLEAEFDNSGEITQVKQWENFRFQKAAHQGSAEHANIDLKSGQTRLSNQARVWDESDSVNADIILLGNNTEHIEAHGNVSSTHHKTTGKSEAHFHQLFNSNSPVFATAESLLKKNDSMHYQGKARLWQKNNRIEAHSITVDQASKKLTAQGGVKTTIRTQRSTSGEKTAAQHVQDPVRVYADSLDYNEITGKAIYRNRVKLTQKKLIVLSNEMEGFLEKQASGAVELQVAFARGSVTISKIAGSGQEDRKGFGTAAEYRPKKDWVALVGTPARLRSTDGRETRGAHLIYYLDQDRVLVNGNGQQRTYSYRPQK